jgi:hypothetical protein
MGTSRGIWTSTPLRQSLAMAALFALVSLVSLAATYVIVRDNAEQSIRTALEQEMTSFRALPNAAAVVTFVRSQSATASPEDRILSYVLRGGLHVGNAALVMQENGYADGIGAWRSYDDRPQRRTIGRHSGRLSGCFSVQPDPDNVDCRGRRRVSGPAHSQTS